MTDGTEALSGANPAQPAAPDAGVPAVEQAEGASAVTKDAGAEAWTAPEGMEEHLGVALGKLPSEQREVFLALDDSGLSNVRDLVLKGVDYTQKRQKESQELRDLKAKMEQMQVSAAAWAEAQADPATAAKMFQAYANRGVDPAEAKPPVNFNDIWDAQNPEDARKLAQDWADGIKTEIRQSVQKEQAESPYARQQAAAQAVTQIRQSAASGLDDAAWGRVLQGAQETLNREGVDYASLSPQQLRLVLSPGIDYETRSAATRVEGINPAALSGDQATSLRGTSAGANRTTLKQPGPDAPMEEKLAWLAKKQGKSSLSELFG